LRLKYSPEEEYYAEKSQYQQQIEQAKAKQQKLEQQT
jgi:hypothetical protein